jgi:hypothetical protein
MATKEKNAPSEEVDPCQVCSTALGEFERSNGRTQGAAVKRRPSQPVSRADAQPALAVICGRSYTPRSTTNNQCVRMHNLHSNVGRDLSVYK